MRSCLSLVASNRPRSLAPEVCGNCTGWLPIYITSLHSEPLLPTIDSTLRAPFTYDVTQHPELPSPSFLCCHLHSRTTMARKARPTARLLNMARKSPFAAYQHSKYSRMIMWYIHSLVIKMRQQIAERLKDWYVLYAYSTNC
jgi:hypothetical protein